MKINRANFEKLFGLQIKANFMFLNVMKKN